MGLAALGVEAPPASAQTETMQPARNVEMSESADRVELYRTLLRLHAMTALLIGDASKEDVERLEHMDAAAIEDKLQSMPDATPEFLRTQIDEMRGLIEKALRELPIRRLG